MRILTWNLVLGRPSFQAPGNWTIEDNLAMMLETIVSFRPDLISLQELPFETIMTQKLEKLGYNSSARELSHCGYVQLYFRDSFKMLGEWVESHSVIIHLEKDGQELQFAGSHLAPFPEYQDLRITQIERVMSHVDLDVPFIYAGDMNMQEDETDEVLATFGFKDAFIESGEPIDHMHTWDTYKNKFYKDVRASKKRFDRVFLASINPKSFSLLGDQPIQRQNHAFYLSDHFGIVFDFDYSK